MAATSDRERVSTLFLPSSLCPSVREQRERHPQGRAIHLVSRRSQARLVVAWPTAHGAEDAASAVPSEAGPRPPPFPFLCLCAVLFFLPASCPSVFPSACRSALGRPVWACHSALEFFPFNTR